MFFKVSAHAEGTPRNDANPPEFCNPIPAGFFTTRYVAAPNEERAKEVAFNILAIEIETFGFWSAHNITIEIENAVSV